MTENRSIHNYSTYGIYKLVIFEKRLPIYLKIIAILYKGKLYLLIGFLVCFSDFVFRTQADTLSLNCTIKPWSS